MHEWKTASALAGRVLEAGADARRVTNIRVRLGPGSHLTEQTLRDHLGMLTAGSNAEGASIDVVAARADDGETDVVLESIAVED